MFKIYKKYFIGIMVLIFITTSIISGLMFHKKTQENKSSKEYNLTTYFQKYMDTDEIKMKIIKIHPIPFKLSDQ